MKQKQLSKKQSNIEFARALLKMPSEQSHPRELVTSFIWDVVNAYKSDDYYLPIMMAFHYFKGSIKEPTQPGEDVLMGSVERYVNLCQKELNSRHDNVRWVEF